MNWKAGIQITDIQDGQRIELTCRVCNGFRFVQISDLKNHPNLKPQYLDEDEAIATCVKWGCGGACRLALSADSQTEGFQGGLA